jgi:pimeloyl-ACP methyl ester carboxylesterase
LRRLKWVALAVGIVLVLAIAAFVVWGSTPMQPMPEALAALQSDGQVKVSTQPWLVFEPISQTAHTGLIFYPGARVDPRAYAPAAHALAAQGYQVVIVPMPLNFAIFGTGKADEVIKAYPDVQHWAIGGHSLGGAMAASYAYSHPGAVDGLVFWAAYPGSNNSLANSDLKVTSIYGTRDGLATQAKIDASRPLLPADTRWVAIEGGDHAQFGWYGPQSGDNPATIDRAAQQAQVEQATARLLAGLQQP